MRTVKQSNLSLLFPYQHLLDDTHMFKSQRIGHGAKSKKVTSNSDDSVLAANYYPGANYAISFQRVLNFRRIYLHVAGLAEALNVDPLENVPKTLFPVKATTPEFRKV